MSWTIHQQGSAWCVIGPDGATIASHATKEKAEAQRRALYASQAQTLMAPVIGQVAVIPDEGLRETADLFRRELGSVLAFPQLPAGDLGVMASSLARKGRAVRAKALQAGAVLGADLSGALKAVATLTKINKKSGDALAAIRRAIGGDQVAPGNPAPGASPGAPEAAPDASTAADGEAEQPAFTFDPNRLEDRGTEWLYLVTEAAGELAAEPVPDEEGVSIVYATLEDGTETQVGYLFDKQLWPEVGDVQAWLEQALGAPAEPAMPTGEAMPEAEAGAQAPPRQRSAQAALLCSPAQAGRYVSLRDLLSHVKDTFLPYNEHGYLGPLTPDQRILLGSSLEAIRDGIHNIHDAEEAKEVPKREGIVDDKGLGEAVKKLAELLESVGAPGTAETMLQVLAETPAKPAQAAGPSAPIVGQIPMPPPAAGSPEAAAQVSARRLMRRAVQFACLSCKATIRGERHCPGCGKSTAEMLRQIAGEPETAPAAAPAAPARTTPAAPATSAATPARRPVPAPVIMPAAPPPAPAPVLVATQAALADLATIMAGATFGPLGEIGSWIEFARRVRPHQALRQDQKSIKGLLEIDLKQLVIHNRGMDDEWAEAKALVLTPGMRRDKKAAFTPECPAKSAQGFADADVWFMHRPEIGKPGSQGVLYDKAGRCVDPIVENGSLYVTMKVVHPWPISMLKKAAAAGIQDFYEVSFDGLIYSQEVKTPDGRTFDLVHQVFPRSVDFVDKGAVEGARLIPQAADLQEEPMLDPTSTTAPAAAPAASPAAAATPRPAWLSPEDQAFDERVAYLQNHMTTMGDAPIVVSQALNYAIDNRPFMIKATAAELIAKAKEFRAAQAAVQPAGSTAGTQPTTEAGLDRIDTVRGVWKEFFDPNSSMPKSLHYALKCSKAAMGLPSTTPTAEEVETFFPLWSKHSVDKNRLASKTLGLHTVGAQAQQHGDEAYIPDDKLRGIEAKSLTLKALQNGLIRDATDHKVEASQAAIDLAAIAYAVQDAMDITKMERMASILSGAGLGAPASIAISKEKAVDHTIDVHEIEATAPDVFQQVAELANYSQIASPSTRDWKDKAVLYGGYATISEEARKNDRAGILAELPDLMVEAMLWLEYLSVFSPFLNNSLLQDGSNVFNSTEGNIIAAGYTFAQYVNLLVLGISGVDWSIGTGVNRRHIAWNPVGAVTSPALWAQLVRDTSSADKPDTSDRASNVVTHGFGGIKNYAMSHFASAGITDRLIVFGDKSKGPIGTMLRYEGRPTPELYIADQRSAPGPNWLANSYQIKIRHGFRYFVKSRKNVKAIVP